MTSKKKILVAPLNWGLGHATRCIPIINALKDLGFQPVIASDGDALALLQKEFPGLISYSLPGYDISYSQSGKLKFRVLLQAPKMLRAMIKERKAVQRIHEKEGFIGIISDNRFGVYVKGIPSVYITRQIRVLSGNTTAISSKIHRQFISKFDECWIPDQKNKLNLSGELSRSASLKAKLKYIGILSRFEKKAVEKKYSLLVVLSGPEPQRTLLEQKLVRQLAHFDKKVLFVRGCFSKETLTPDNPNIEVKNYLLSEELERVIMASELVLARSGYSTLMDLTKLEKKAFFIPTPGQYEQHYLAKRCEELKIAPFCSQENFDLKDLDRIQDYTGFNGACQSDLPVGLFDLFQGK
ncbi:MAG: glycosyltransferase [Flavobacteriaceae bacterium]|nr:glycosyltransferase [Flavobacteriaceae bacterium]